MLLPSATGDCLRFRSVRAFGRQQKFRDSCYNRHAAQEIEAAVGYNSAHKNRLLRRICRRRDASPSIQTARAPLPDSCPRSFCFRRSAADPFENALETAGRAAGDRCADLAADLSGQTGHPVLFDRKCAGEILRWPPARPLKTLITRLADVVSAVPVFDPAILADVDNAGRIYERRPAASGRRITVTKTP